MDSTLHGLSKIDLCVLGKHNGEARTFQEEQDIAHKKRLKTCVDGDKAQGEKKIF